MLREQIETFDPWAMVENRMVLLRSGVILLATVLGFVFAQQLGVGMDFIAMVGATAALLFAGKALRMRFKK